MGKIVCVALAAAMGLAAPACSAQDWAKAMLAKSPRHGEYVVIKEANGRNLQAFVVYPEVKDKAPVIVLIHEIFGESDWFKEMADELAGAGYIVVAPDLLSGFGPPPTTAGLPPTTPIRMTPCPVWASGIASGSADSCIVTVAQINEMMARIKMPGSMSGMGCDPMACAPGQKPVLERVSSDGMENMDHDQMQQTPGAGGAAYVPMNPGGTSAFPDQPSVTKAVSSLPDAQVLADLDAAADYGKKLPAANGKLFVAGFCWGGGKSFLYATHRHDLSAAFVFYGPPPSPDLIKNITAPVYGFYAGNDARIDASIPKATEDMKAAGKKYEPVTYDGAGHGFMRAGQDPTPLPANAPANAADVKAANVTAWNEGFKRMLGILSSAH
jgi:carboxymethylenebutenolidase